MEVLGVEDMGPVLEAETDSHICANEGLRTTFHLNEVLIGIELDVLKELHEVTTEGAHLLGSNERVHIHVSVLTHVVVPLVACDGRCSQFLVSVSPYRQSTADGGQPNHDLVLFLPSWCRRREQVVGNIGYGVTFVVEYRVVHTGIDCIHFRQKYRVYFEGGIRKRLDLRVGVDIVRVRVCCIPGDETVTFTSQVWVEYTVDARRCSLVRVHAFSTTVSFHNQKLSGL
ncbi:hypothetical protein KXD40_000355 [Peronospora effusa]|nr:hypothetical protein KXD40_000355 [Peronospora effusa]